MRQMNRGSRFGWYGIADPARAFAHDFLRQLVFAQSLVRGLAYLAARRPAAKGDFDDALRFDETRVTASLGRQCIGERRLRHPIRLEQFVKLLRDLHRIAGADAPGMHELAVVIVGGHE